MHTNHNQVRNINKSSWKITAPGLIRRTGLTAMLAGILFIVIQMIHPPETLASVTTPKWAIVHYFTLVMALCGLIGLTGIYSRQVKESGWLGLAGYFLFSFFWIATAAFTFVEAFILPVVADDAPEFVEGFLGIFSGGAIDGVDLGVLPAVAPVAGVMYILSGLFLGIATLRAGILPRWAAALLAFGSVATLASAVIPHPFDRILAVPMGIALIGLGYALWSERR